MLNRQKIKKLFLTLLTTLEIILLTLGNFSVAQAVHIPSTEDILNDLHIDIGNAQEGGEYGNVSSTKETATSVSLMFSPTNPKVGDKITATALPIGFMSSKDNLYFTWFLKRKDCDIKPKNYDPEKDYGSDFLSDDTSGVIRTEKDCDSDGDGLITVNDWKVDAQKMIAQNGFTPDLGGKYTDLNDFYTIHDNLNETEDSDGYQAWQGGVDAERMPSHCYGFHGTNGLAYELTERLFGGNPMCANPNGIGGTNKKLEVVCGQTKEWVPKPVPQEDPCACAEDEDLDGFRDIPFCLDCKDGIPFVNATLGYNYQPPLNSRPGFSYPTAGEIVADGKVQWWECLIDMNYCDAPNDGSAGNYAGGVGGAQDFQNLHMDCHKQNTLANCEKQAEKPHCVKIKGGDYDGQYAAVCGKDANEDGIGDNYDTQFPGVPMCPSSGAYKIGDEKGPFNISETNFNTAVTSGETYQDDEYIFARAGRYAPYDKLPVCSCNKVRSLVVPPGDGDTPLPYIGDESDPLCADRSPEKSDLLCQFGAVASTTRQFHVFAKKIPSNKNYYEYTRDYSESDDNAKFILRIDRDNIGDNSFGLEDEKFWGTDPRNPSTAGNGKSDEANLAGAGADTFSWTYEEGDEVGVAVEGASVMPTKYSDSSRMIFWGFSQGPTLTTNQKQKDKAACQPVYGGDFETPDGSGDGDTVSVRTGFLDFDKCIANSTIAPVSGGGGLGGGQPTQMEAELSVSPDNPVNDESGDNTGDILDIQSSVKNASKGESDLYYSWEIQKLAPVPVNGVSIQPLERDWTPNTNFCGKGIAYCSQPEEANCCPFLDENKKKLKVVGTGLTNLNFRLNLPTTEFNENGDLYLNVKLTIRESETDSNTPNSRVGRANAVVKVSSTSNRISIFKPEIIGGAGNEQLTEPATDASICKTGADRYICPVSKNEIIGLKVPATADRGSTTGEPLTNFNWKLNGKALDCDLTMSNKCANDQGTAYNFIPITGNAGDTLTVEVKSSNVAGSSTTATGRSIALVQKFKIVEPSIEIISPDNSATAKKLGSFVDPTKIGEGDPTGPKYTDDLSKSVLETTAGANVTLAIDYIPDYVEDSSSGFVWMIDGQVADEPTLTAGTVGTIHTVKAAVTYTQPPKFYRALKEKFNVSPSEMKDQVLSSSIQVEVNQEANATTMIKKSTRFLASLLDKIPVQTMFLIRLFLSVLLVVALTGIIFAFFPEVQYDGERK